MSALCLLRIVRFNLNLGDVFGRVAVGGGLLPYSPACDNSRRIFFVVRKFYLNYSRLIGFLESFDSLEMKVCSAQFVCENVKVMPRFDRCVCQRSSSKARRHKLVVAAPHRIDDVRISRNDASL